MPLQRASARIGAKLEFSNILNTVFRRRALNNIMIRLPSIFRLFRIFAIHTGGKN